MTYLEALNYLESFINYEKIPSYHYKESLKLERIENFLKTLGNPQKYLKCIHIAGTKGKGSTCAFITYILKEAGYKVGLYTSPHLSDFRERIRILKPRSPKVPGGGKERDFEGIILKSELINLVERFKPSIGQYNRNSAYGPLSFFEVYTCLAFIYFREKKVDFAVLETGMGGRLDATNVVNPLICAITPISYEHTQKLGNTLKEIATEKAGIIKAGKLVSSLTREPIVISAPQEKEAMEVIRNRCKETNAKLTEMARQIKYATNDDHRLRIKGVFGEYPDLRLRLLGAHQLVNAALAVAVIEALRFCDINVGIEAVRKGIYNTLWPGRCEIVSKKPLVILDGAQNIASAKALKETIRDNFKYKRIIVILGISNDKDIKGICNELYDLTDEVILTKANSPRAADPEILMEYFKGKDTHLTNNVKEAINLARQKSKEKHLILITGSLFVVGEARFIFK